MKWFKLKSLIKINYMKKKQQNENEMKENKEKLNVKKIKYQLNIK